MTEGVGGGTGWRASTCRVTDNAEIDTKSPALRYRIQREP